MFAYGAGPCRQVDLVTGPGNIYTVSAKRLLKGIVGIDSEAGPTEIAILADDTADPAYVAADLLSQAEHDPMAAAVLVTTSTTLADEVEAELDKQVSVTRHVERIRTALSGRAVRHRAGRRPRAGPAVVDAYAAEHLEIQTRDAAALARRVRNAGAIFVGPFRRSRWATTAPAPTTCCPPAAAPATLRPVGAVVPQGAARHRVRRAGAARRRPARRDAGRGRGPARSRRGRARARRGDERPMSRSRCARSCAGSSRTAPRSSTYPSQLNVNENPYAPERGGRRRRRGRGRGRDPHAEPLPGPGVHRAARGPRGLPRARRRRPPRCGPRTAPTR